jgi:hypothetical protein
MQFWEWKSPLLVPERFVPRPCWYFTFLHAGSVFLHGGMYQTSSMEECSRLPAWRNVPDFQHGGIYQPSSTEECTRLPAWRNIPTVQHGGMYQTSSMEECTRVSQCTVATSLCYCRRAFIMMRSNPLQSHSLSTY